MINKIYSIKNIAGLGKQHPQEVLADPFLEWAYCLRPAFLFYWNDWRRIIEIIQKYNKQSGVYKSDSIKNMDMVSVQNEL